MRKWENEKTATLKNWGKNNDIKELGKEKDAKELGKEKDAKEVGKEKDVTNKVTEQLLKSHQACENKTSWLNQDIHMRN